MPFVLRQLSIPLMGIMLVTLVSCSGYDGEYFPYAMTGLNVWVYDKEVSKEWFVGFVKSSYFSRSDGASQCAVLAGIYARQHHFQDWSYVCCTVTSSYSCMTKVR